MKNIMLLIIGILLVLIGVFTPMHPLLSGLITGIGGFISGWATGELIFKLLES